MNRIQRYTTVGLTAGLLAGGVVGSVVGVPALSASGTNVATTPGASTPALVQQDDGGTEAPTDGDEPERGERLRTHLQDLVDDGTLTAEQADAVVAHLAEQVPHRDRPGRLGGRQFGDRPMAAVGRVLDGEIVAELLALEPAALRELLLDGATVAELADERGVDPQTIIDRLVEDAVAHIDVSVEQGRLDDEEAAQRGAQVIERITRFVEEGGPGRR